MISEIVSRKRLSRHVKLQWEGIQVYSIRVDFHYRARDQRAILWRKRLNRLAGDDSGIVVFMGTCSVCNSFKGYRVERNSASRERGRVPAAPAPIIRGNTLAIIPRPPPPPTHRYIPTRDYNRERSTCQLLWGRDTHPSMRYSPFMSRRILPRTSPVHSDVIAS